LKWYHRRCLDRVVTRKDWESLTGDNQYITFKCLDCLQGRGDRVSELREIRALIEEKFKESNEQIRNLEQDILKKVDKKIDDKVSDLHNKQKTMDDKMRENIKKQEDRFQKIENELWKKEANQNKDVSKEEKKSEMKFEKKLETELKVYMDQKEDKEKRKNNIVILRLQEQTGNNREENLEKDKVEVKKIMEVINTNPEYKAELEELINKKKYLRLGRTRTEGKIRPIKIELPDEEMKRSIFQGCKNLRDSEYNHISIQNDLTKDEQETNYKLRKELRERLANNENVCIFRNQIIDAKDHPKNIEKEKKEKEKQKEEEKKNEEEKKQKEEKNKEEEEKTE